ncbi:hypothetical protein ABZV92_18590 [Streptomyces rubiginosohelvolus]|uniref:hypothetical protein n=1 Tax=Streptomyces rubiginosohelvolus TaxID=67362 RepID=UPI0033A2E995
MTRLLYGTGSAELRRREEAGQLNEGTNEAVLRRLLERVGVSRLLAPGEDLMTADGQLRGVLRLSDGQDHDLLQLVPRLLRHKIADDRAYEADSGRAAQVTAAQGLEPGDAAILRHRSVSPAALNPCAAEDIEGGALTQVYLLMALMATYTASPHFIPAPAAFDAATGLPPEPEAELRLPAETVLLFHDGIPLPAVTADDAALHAHATVSFSAMNGVDDSFFDREPLIVGGLLMGHPGDGTDDDHLLDEDLGWLMIARRADDGTNLFSQTPVTHLENTGPAARILRNYAALLALEGWDVPPPMPGRARTGGKGSKKGSSPSPAERRRRAQTPQARAGALLRVRSLTAPPQQPAPTLPAQASVTEGRARAQYREWRRAYFTRNTRRHILDTDGRPVLDEHGRPSGPVYGPGAVEGVTFTRRRTWVRGTWINEHLPPRPGAAPVYALDPRLARTTPEPG